jgi:hypothetical protein
MEYRQNEQLLLATEFVQYTNQNIFLTGKAGTGKTTFLHNLKKITPKRMVVVAPTGVAAINAGGVTIHSFFQLSFAPSIPGLAPGRSHANHPEGNIRKISREKINLIKCIDLLVIDEISMVRADVLDAVDEVLRRYRNPGKPFGDVQLLMIGDLHQLSPVIREPEWNILKDYYQSIYFFDSLALKKTNPVTIELKEIFRQSDAYFISLLNKVRENAINSQTIMELNTRHIPGFQCGDDEGYITLTTHNAIAFGMNQAKLAGLKGNASRFSAEISGDFPPQNYPTEEQLELKPQAQVMFIKNDLSGEKLYYNGKIGKITRIEEETVFVKCPADDSEIAVGRVIWENVKYTLDEETKEIKEDIAGTFTQVPLKLAWAITIHKSQGLTFDKVIIDANAAFAFGQVYVALSRCRTFGGIVLSTPIAGSGIRTDTLVQKYSNDVRQHEPGPDKLRDSKYLYQKELILELFDFKLAKYRFDSLIRPVKENSRILDTGLPGILHEKREICDAGFFKVAEKFLLQIMKLMDPEVLPEENTVVQNRVKQAAAYFSEFLNKHLKGFPETLNLDTDNKAVRKLLTEALEKFQKEVFIKMSVLGSCRDGFETISYIKAKSGAEVDFKPSVKRKTKDNPPSKNIQHPELYHSIRNWRNALADDVGIPEYMILPQRSIVELTNKLPTTITELKTIKGIGQVKINQYGTDIITMIKQFCKDNNIVPEQIEVPVVEKKAKVNSGKISFEMFVSGKTVAEIAAERGVTSATIEGHLAHYVGTGELKVTEFVPEEKLQKVLQYIHEHPNDRMGEIKSALGEGVTYGDLKFIIQYLLYSEK